MAFLCRRSVGRLRPETSSPFTNEVNTRKLFFFFSFLNLHTVIWNPTPEKTADILPTFDNSNELEKEGRNLKQRDFTFRVTISQPQPSCFLFVCFFFFMHQQTCCVKIAFLSFYTDAVASCNYHPYWRIMPHWQKQKGARSLYEQQYLSKS